LVGVITAHLLCANVTTGLNPGISTATASVADATMTIPGVPVVSFGAIKATSQSSCAGSSGLTTIASLRIDGRVVDVSNVKPNTTINVGPLTLILNEQRPVPGADFGLTVNGVHIIVNGLVHADVIFTSATSDVHNC
jgi:hypothetical protein